MESDILNKTLNPVLPEFHGLIPNFDVTIGLNETERKRRGPEGYDAASVFGAKSAKGFARILFGNDSEFFYHDVNE